MRLREMWNTLVWQVPMHSRIAKRNLDQFLFNSCLLEGIPTLA